MRSLHRTLLNAELLRLRAIARFWDVTLTSNRQRDVACELDEAIRALLAEPESINDACEALSEAERSVLSDLLAAEGEMPMRVLIRRWGDIRAMGPGRMEREKPWLSPVSPVESLWYKGFIARAFVQGAEGAYEVGFVPLELQTPPSRSSFSSSLSPPPPLSPSLDIEIKALAPPPVVMSGGEALLDDACTFLAYLQNERVHAPSGDDWPSTHWRRLNRQLRHSEAERFAFLRHLARRLGWLRVTDARLLRPEPEAASAWLQSTPTEQQQALFVGWRDDPTWNDLFHVPTLVPEDTGAWRNDPVLARKAVLHDLTMRRQPMTWYAIDDLVATIKHVDFDFQRPDGDYDTWYIRHAETGAYLSGCESWDDVEGALIRYLITCPLLWLGVVDVGREHEMGAWTAFRVSAIGARLLDLEMPDLQPEEANFATIREDFTVRAPSARRYERFQLSRVADWVSSPAICDAPLQATFVYRLTPNGLSRARSQGIPIARVLAFLDRVTGEESPVPRFVETALTRWDARGREVYLAHVLLLRVSDAEILDQITASPRLNRLLDHRVGPTAALVKDRDCPRLIVELGKMGLLPDVDLEVGGDW